MVNTNISDLGSQICLDPTTAVVTTGVLYEDTYPGQYVIPVSGDWIKAVNTTEAYRYMKGGVVEYRRRINNSGGVPTIDEVYDISAEPALDTVEIIKKGKVLVFIDDPQATYYPGALLQISSTAGNLVIVSANEATGATSGTALRGTFVAQLFRKAVSGDTKAVVELL